jgi:hypothetical protein
MLQSQFAIVQNPTKQPKKNVISNILHACVIVQNTIIENESIMGLEPCFSKGSCSFRCMLSFEDILECI